MNDKHLLFLLRKENFLTDKTYQKALASVSKRDDKQALFVRLTAAGVGFILAGITCFVAANWQTLGDVLKFALPLGGLLSCALGVYWKKLDTVPGQAFAFAMGLFIGLFLAVFGQTYQTGAFLYELFGLWFLLLIPLCILAKNKWLWLLAVYIGGTYILSKGEIYSELKTVYPQFMLYGLAAWAVAVKCRVSRGFQRWFWVPLGLYAWGIGMEQIVFKGSLFHAVSQNYFWAAMLLSIVACYWAHRTQDSVLFGWNMLLLAGLLIGLLTGKWFNLDTFSGHLLVRLLAVVIFAGAGVSSYLFWRTHREEV